MEFTKRGPNWTFHYMKIIDCFDPGYQEQVLIKILKDFGKVYSDISMGDWDIKNFGKTLLGDSYELNVTFRYPYGFKVGCYRDGWHIALYSRKNQHLSFSDKELIFGDPNRSQMWTTENEKVAEMMIACANEVQKNWEDMSR